MKYTEDDLKKELDDLEKEKLKLKKYIYLSLELATWEASF